MLDGLEACSSLLMHRSIIFMVYFGGFVNLETSFMDYFLMVCGGRKLGLWTLRVLVILYVNDGLYVFRTHEKHDCGLKFQEETLFGYFFQKSEN